MAVSNSQFLDDLITAIIAATPPALYVILALRSRRTEERKDHHELTTSLDTLHGEVRTRGDRKIGQYVEELAVWARRHTAEDQTNINELRAILGLPPKYPTVDPPDLPEHEEPCNAPCADDEQYGRTEVLGLPET